MYERKKLLPLRDAIFLHLEPLSSRANPYTMPDSTCQEAMSERLSASRGNLSRVMNELLDGGFITEMRAHVPTGTLRRKTYILTEVGMREARHLRRSTGEKDIRLKDEEGKEVKVMLRDVPRELRDGSTLLDIALNVHKGVFDKQAYIESLRKESPFICIETQRPRSPSFFGRDKELGSISKWYRSKKRILEIKGIAGIGKTALVAEAFTKLSEETNTLWLGISEQTSMESAMEDIAAFLKLLGRESLDMFLKLHREDQEQDTLEAVSGGRKVETREDGYKRRDDFLFTLGTELQDLEALVVFDGCERAQKEMAEFIGLMIGKMRDHPGWKIILSGRNLSGTPGIRDWRKSKISEGLNVNKLDFESAKQILQLRGVETWRLEDIYKQTGGLPFFLELMAPSHESLATDVDAYLEEEILYQLTPEEERVLAIISVFSEPVHSDAFFQWRSMKFETIRSLVDRSLLTEVSPMVYDTHDLLKEFASRGVSDKRRKSYHKKAAAHYLEEGTIEDVLRAATHLIGAGDRVKAGYLLAEEGRNIIAKGHSRELFQLLQELEREKRLNDVSDLAFLRGECLSMRGLWDEALQEYDQSLLLSEAEDDQAGMAQALRKVAEIQMLRGNYEEVMGSFERSAAISEKLGDLEGLTECYYNMAANMWVKGDLEESELCVRKCLEVSNLSENPTAIARAYRGLGILTAEAGRKKKAMSTEKKAVEYARISGDMALMSMCLDNLAGSYYELDDFDKALELEEEAFNLARRIGAARTIAHSLSNLSSLHVVQGDSKTAEKLANEAFAICQDLKEHRLMAEIHTRYAHIYKEKDWKKAKAHLSKSLELMNMYGSPSDRCEYYTYAGRLIVSRAEERGTNPEKEGISYIHEAASLLDDVPEVLRRKEFQRRIDDALRYLSREKAGR